jgi:hypothetical protein
MTPLCAAASYSIEYEGTRAFLSWASAPGPFEHPDRPLAPQQGRTPPTDTIPGATVPCPDFPGAVQFFVGVISASNFQVTENPPVVEFCHFAGPPEAPTATADLAGGIPGWPRARARTATVGSWPAHLGDSVHFPAGLLNRGVCAQLTCNASTGLTTLNQF